MKLRRRATENLGQRMLGLAAAGHEVAHRHVEWVHAEGGTDDDIVGYYAAPEREREVLDNEDRALKMAFFLTEREAGLDDAAAVAKMRKALVLYGDAEVDAAEGVAPEDRRLPIELRWRIEPWIARQLQDVEQLHAETAAHTSMNAWVREAIRAGEL